MHCIFCKNIVHSAIKRFKQHLADSKDGGEAPHTEELGEGCVDVDSEDGRKAPCAEELTRYILKLITLE